VPLTTPALLDAWISGRGVVAPGAKVPSSAVRRCSKVRTPDTTVLPTYRRWAGLDTPIRAGKRDGATKPSAFESHASTRLASTRLASPRTTDNWNRCRLSAPPSEVPKLHGRPRGNESNDGPSSPRNQRPIRIQVQKRCPRKLPDSAFLNLRTVLGTVAG
jgi:hypothetical protein